jgi:photosystem II stability/assembly factor-like uncharacterized protein
VGSGGSIYRSIDFGVNWTLQTSGTLEALHDGNGSGIAYVVGDNGTILKTSDTGGTWTPKPSGTSMDLYAFKPTANGVLLAAGEGGTMLRSTNAGDSWTLIATPTVATLRDLDTSGQNSNWILACGDGGTLLRSTDNGLTWCHINSGTSTNLNGVDMVTNAQYIVAGDSGLLKLTSTSGGGCYDVTGVLPANEIPSGLSLSAVRPLPLRGSGVLHLAVDRDQEVEVVLVDAAGRRVASIYEGLALAAQPLVLNVDARRLDAGVYFVHATGASESARERVVILR